MMFKNFFLIALCALTSTTNSIYLRSKEVPSWDSQSFTGDWIQISSNYFVQTTSEVDWKCVRVTVNQTTNNILTIGKSPYIHGVYYSPNKVVNNYTENDKTLENGPNSLVIKALGPIIDEKYDYTILAGIDNITLFIWARNYYRYFHYQDEINSLITSWKYTASYKAPLNSFDQMCLIIN